jgi:signal transduction histidine kinase
MPRTRSRSNRSSARRESLQLRDNALAIVAHDLRSPLNTIVLAAELLQEMTADEKSRHFLETILRAAHQADVLIRDLVDVTRVESGRFLIEKHHEPLAYLLANITQMFEPTASQAGVLLACDVREIEGLSVPVDSSRFVQLISNLVSNAIKFTAPGGTVLVSATRSDRFVEIRIRDSGIGISGDDLPHVFERFWQAAHHRRAGAGLGLAIAKGIVEAHNGEIDVASDEGRGSVFWFTLPIAS